MDWLYRAEPQLSEDVPVGGDRDLVSDLMDKHKVGVPGPCRELPAVFWPRGTPGERRPQGSPGLCTSPARGPPAR